MKTTRVIQLKRQSPAVLAGAIVAALAIGATGTWLWLSNQKQTYWAVAQPATIGTNLDEVTLVKVAADFGLTESTYLAGNQRPTGFLTQPLLQGQLLQESSISQSEVGNFSHLVVPVSSALSAKLHPGSTVQVWVATRFGSEFAPASLLTEDAIMVNQASADSVFKSATLEVEIQIPSDLIEATLDAIATESAIYLVPKA